MQNLTLDTLPEGVYPDDYVSTELHAEAALHGRVALAQFAHGSKLKRLDKPPSESHYDWDHRTGRFWLNAAGKMPNGVQKVGHVLKVPVVGQIKRAGDRYVFQPVSVAGPISHVVGDEWRKYQHERDEFFRNAGSVAESSTQRTGRFATQQANRVAWASHLTSPPAPSSTFAANPNAAPEMQSRAEQREEMSRVQRGAHTTEPKGPISRKIEKLRAAENEEPTQ